MHKNFHIFSLCTVLKASFIKRHCETLICTRRIFMVTEGRQIKMVKSNDNYFVNTATSGISQCCETDSLTYAMHKIHY